VAEVSATLTLGRALSESDPLSHGVAEMLADIYSQSWLSVNKS
jgi:hypothetical protein